MIAVNAEMNVVILERNVRFEQYQRVAAMDDQEDVLWKFIKESNRLRPDFRKPEFDTNPGRNAVAVFKVGENDVIGCCAPGFIVDSD